MARRASSQSPFSIPIKAIPSGEVDRVVKADSLVKTQPTLVRLVTTVSRPHSLSL